MKQWFHRAIDFVLGWFDFRGPSLDDMIDERGIVHFEMRSRAWWAGLRFHEELRQKTQFWSCDQCAAMGKPRRIWQPLLWGHELKHTDEEWAAAGYDKAGTLRGPNQ